MTGHLYELTDAEAETLAAAARILSERTIGSVWGVSVQASREPPGWPGLPVAHVRLVAHMQSGTDAELGWVPLDENAARGLAATVKVHNARRSARP